MNIVILNMDVWEIPVNPSPSSQFAKSTLVRLYEKLYQAVLSYQNKITIFVDAMYATCR